MRQVLRHLDRAAVSAVAAVTTNSRYSVGRIHEAYGRHATVIPCGVTDGFQPPATPVARDHLLTVGTLIPSKGHDLAIEAAGRSGLGFPVVVVTPRHNPEEEARLRAIADRAGVEVVVKVGVTDEELAALYQSAVVTLYMAQLEPFGLVSIEAQSCGCPVIVSDEGGLAETLVSGVTGWSVARQVGPIAERLSQFKDPALSERLGRAAAADSGRWSWNVSAKRLQAVFTSVAR
jgi:glycosyltransferase involved in cell wall biosynthesis